MMSGDRSTKGVAYAPCSVSTERWFRLLADCVRPGEVRRVADAPSFGFEGLIGCGGSSGYETLLFKSVLQSCVYEKADQPAGTCRQGNV